MTNVNEIHEVVVTTKDITSDAIVMKIVTRITRSVAETKVRLKLTEGSLMGVSLTRFTCTLVTIFALFLKTICDV